MAIQLRLIHRVSVLWTFASVTSAFAAFCPYLWPVKLGIQPWFDEIRLGIEWQELDTTLDDYMQNGTLQKAGSGLLPESGIAWIGLDFDGAGSNSTSRFTALPSVDPNETQHLTLGDLAPDSPDHSIEILVRIEVVSFMPRIVGSDRFPDGSRIDL